MNRLLVLSGIAGVIFGVVAIREWSYRTDHPFAPGPSAELVALGVAGVLVAIAIAEVARSRNARDQQENEQHRHLWNRVRELENELKAQGEHLEDDLWEDRLFLYDLVDPKQFDEWGDLMRQIRRERVLREAEPEEREVILDLLDQQEILRQKILVARLEELHEFVTRQEGGISDDGEEQP